MICFTSDKLAVCDRDIFFALSVAVVSLGIFLTFAFYCSSEWASVVNNAAYFHFRLVSLSCFL